MVEEQRLLRSVVRLVRRCDERPPPELLDAVLAGTAAVASLVIHRSADRAPPTSGEASAADPPADLLVSEAAPGCLERAEKQKPSDSRVNAH